MKVVVGVLEWLQEDDCATLVNAASDRKKDVICMWLLALQINFEKMKNKKIDHTMTWQ